MVHSKEDQSLAMIVSGLNVITEYLCNVKYNKYINKKELKLKIKSPSNFIKYTYIICKLIIHNEKYVEEANDEQKNTDIIITKDFKLCT